MVLGRTCGNVGYPAHFLTAVSPLSSSMELSLQWTLEPQRAPTSRHRRSRRWLRSTPTYWVLWLEELQTVASGSACWPASVASTSFATRSASQWQPLPSCLLTWCTSTKAWDLVWEPWSVAGTREDQVTSTDISDMDMSFCLAINWSR